MLPQLTIKPKAGYTRLDLQPFSLNLGGAPSLQGVKAGPATLGTSNTTVVSVGQGGTLFWLGGTGSGAVTTQTWTVILDGVAFTLSSTGAANHAIAVVGGFSYFSGTTVYPSILTPLRFNKSLSILGLADVAGTVQPYYLATFDR